MQCISELHEHAHGVPGMLGSLYCMHVHWGKYPTPIAYQGSYLGEEKYTMIALEAVVDNILWFWHAAFGFARSCNNINILDVSPLHAHFLDGSHAKIVNKLYYLVDGIYPQVTQFVKTILIPLTKREKQFTGW